ncbi:hypothetical protein PG993_010490 [Apiospora rasikravindrae]|uniref:Uncharacterized protein n=1 Tax=Apiospora rasikravindrae TaxID=990691 RepID=A0ABR1SP69_9PEZI
MSKAEVTECLSQHLYSLEDSEREGFTIKRKGETYHVSLPIPRSLRPSDLAAQEGISRGIDDSDRKSLEGCAGQSSPGSLSRATQELPASAKVTQGDQVGICDPSPTPDPKHEKYETLADTKQSVATPDIRTTH